MSHVDSTWALEREVVLSRVFEAPRELVFRAWTDENIGKWFGPKGFTCKTHERNVAVGGVWRFDLVAPNGTVYPNRIRYIEVKAPERLVFEHGSDKDDDSGRFHVTITFDSQGQDDKFGVKGRTVVTMRQLHPTKAQRDATVAFGAVELGYQTLDKLDEHIKSR